MLGSPRTIDGKLSASFSFSAEMRQKLYSGSCSEDPREKSGTLRIQKLVAKSAHFRFRKKSFANFPLPSALFLPGELFFCGEGSGGKKINGILFRLTHL